MMIGELDVEAASEVRWYATVEAVESLRVGKAARLEDLCTVRVPLLRLVRTEGKASAERMSTRRRNVEGGTPSTCFAARRHERA